MTTPFPNNSYAVILLLLTSFCLAPQAHSSGFAAPKESPNQQRAGVDLVKVDEVDIPSTDKKFTVVCFLGTECPLAKLYAPRLAKLSQQFESDFQFVAVNSNIQDSESEWTEFVTTNGIQFPIVRDTQQKLADTYSVTRNPHIVVLSSKNDVLYSGRVDNQYSPGVTRAKASRYDLREALRELRAGKAVSVSSTEVEGCIIGRSKPINADAKITYANTIAEIFERNCVECHRSGEIGPFSMESYDDIVGWDEMIVEVVNDGRMPPWHADSAHGEFRNSRALSESEKQLIRQWVKDGLPPGDLESVSTKKNWTTGWRLPKQPDAVFEMRSQPFHVPADGSVEYQYFVIDPGFKEDKWVIAAEVLPGNRSIVHHSIVFIRPPDGQRMLGAGWLAAYVPGQLPIKHNPTRARKIPAGSKLVFQQHYTPNGTAQDDKTRVGVVFADESKIKEELLTLIAIDQKFEIPPKTDSTKVDVRIPYIPSNSKLISINPHMHFRGKSFVAFRGDHTLLKVPKYDFNWQHIYELQEPLDLSNNDSISMQFEFDNSDANPFNPNPDEYVLWGDQTWEEMAVAFFDITRPLSPQESTKPDATTDAEPAKQVAEEPIPEIVQTKTKDFVRRYFDNNDKDNNGVISKSEMPISSRWNFNYADKDRNGTLSKQEITDAVQQRLRIRHQNDQ